METERITLSQRERDRLKVLHEVKQKHLSQVAAAARLKVSARQVRRMLLRLRGRGDSSLILMRIVTRTFAQTLISSLLKNLVFEVFSLSVFSFC